MKIKPISFVVPFLIATVVCSGTVVTSMAKTRLERKHSELIGFLGPPEELVKRGEWRFNAFIGEVMPQLIQMDKNLEIEQRLDQGVKIEDVMIFAYEIARKRLASTTGVEIPLGFWSRPPIISSETMVEEVDLFLKILCYLHLPKPDEYNRKMKVARPVLVEGAYNRLILELSLRRPLFTTSTETLKTYGAPPIDVFINFRAIEMLKEIDSKGG